MPYDDIFMRIASSNFKMENLSKNITDYFQDVLKRAAIYVVHNRTLSDNPAKEGMWYSEFETRIKKFILSKLSANLQALPKEEGLELMMEFFEEFLSKTGRQYRPVIIPVIKEMKVHIEVIRELRRKRDEEIARARELKQIEERKSLEDQAVKPAVGDILYSSSGYNMTLVSFYKVTKVTPSGKSVTLQKLNDKKTGGGYRGYIVPENTFEQPGLVHRNKRVLLTRGGYSVKINNYERAYLWDGKPKYYNTMD
jgi:hypothetical protein